MNDPVSCLLRRAANIENLIAFYKKAIRSGTFIDREVAEGYIRTLQKDMEELMAQAMELEESFKL